MGLYQTLQDQHYLDPTYGMASNYTYALDEKGFNCDNPSLFSAQAMLLSGFDSWPGYARFYNDSEVAQGFMHRYPGSQTDLSFDELIGAATLDETVAREMLAYGRSHFWVFQPQGGKFTWSAWMGRYINLPAYVRHQARGLRWYELHYKLLWSLACVLSPLPPPSDTSGKLLMWVQIQKMRGHYWVCDRAIQFWNYKMRKQYVRGMRDVFAYYFGSSHPFVAYAPTEL